MCVLRAAIKQCIIIVNGCSEPGACPMNGPLLVSNNSDVRLIMIMLMIIMLVDDENYLNPHNPSNKSKYRK